MHHLGRLLQQAERMAVARHVGVGRAEHPVRIVLEQPGVQVVMGDGSVKFIAQTINADIWTAAGTRQGNEPLQLE